MCIKLVALQILKIAKFSIAHLVSIDWPIRGLNSERFLMEDGSCDLLSR